jgi:hypothetical protein
MVSIESRGADGSVDDSRRNGKTRPNHQDLELTHRYGDIDR